MACCKMAKRKCKQCGRRFESKGAGDLYCSPLCRQTGFFLGGGGNTSKPNANGSSAEKPKPVRVRKDDGRFERVRKVFNMPVSERWAVAKDFTDEERAYFRRLAMRQLFESDRFVREWSRDCPEDEEDAAEEVYVQPGDSDDGTL